MSLTPRFKRPFDKNYKKISQENKKRIKNAVDDILLNPKHNSKFAKGQWRCKRERRVGALRIMYSYCQECREETHVSINDCLDCDEITDETIIFWTIIRSHKY